ncbi:hypothetical protein cyc_07313 [Cyclospora cayetanensis]|uniref:Uncharacterized protein n=1 Tax=Cyclospora cayetanensis TaxID=88456 RepID=A0A1D3CTR5_9EIME|nr:hypothetical protein cyc_07313 [Cyclospora cayetanensis]
MYRDRMGLSETLEETCLERDEAFGPPIVALQTSGYIIPMRGNGYALLLSVLVSWMLDASTAIFRASPLARIRRSSSFINLSPPEGPPTPVLTSDISAEESMDNKAEESRSCKQDIPALKLLRVFEGSPKQNAMWSAVLAQVDSPLDDRGYTVEEFLRNSPSRDEILAAAKNQQKFKLGPVDKMPMQSCGAYPMARIYSPDEVVRRLKLHYYPCFGPLDDMIREYNLFVTEHAEVMSKVRESILAKPHKAFRLAYIQWNSLMVIPNTLQVLTAFLNEDQGFAVDQVDGITILLQENLRLKGRRKKLFLENIHSMLNTLSSNPNWGEAKLSYLGNILGTQVDPGAPQNTQTIIYIFRETHQPVEVCKASQSINGREKGFIGAVFDLPQMGKLAVMGAHLDGWMAPQFLNMFPLLLSSCGSTEEGLDSFSLGVVLGGDWNEHFHTEAMDSLYELAGTDTVRYPAFDKVQDLPSTMPNNLKMTALFTEALSEPLDIIGSDYQPLLWSGDRLGRSVNMGHSPFSVLKTCLEPKVLASPRGAGYLDRVIVRTATASSAALDQLLEAGAVTGELPKNFASIVKGVQVYDMRSDHVMMGNIIEFLQPT